MAIKKIAKFNVDDIKIKENTLTEHLLQDSNCLDDRYYTETEIDTKLNSKSDTSHAHDYLPLSGGIMVGDITYNNPGNRFRISNSQGSGIGHPYIEFFPPISGQVAINSCKDDEYSQLNLYPDNRLTISHKIGQLGNWVTTDITGSSIVAKSIGQNGYIKYASGLIIQWGIALYDSAGSKKAITLALSFPSTNYRTIICPMNTNNETSVRVVAPFDTGRTNSTFYVIGSNKTYFEYIVIGC